MGQGRAQALKVRLELGPGLSPSINSWLRPSTGLQIYYLLNEILRFSGPFRAWALIQKFAPGLIKNKGPGPRPCPGPITNSHKFTEDEISASKKTINSTTSFPCNLPKSVGPCTKSLHRYYYDLVTQTCKPFVFGGCRGNANNFITLQDCNEKCKPSILTSESSLSSSRYSIASFLDKAPRDLTNAKYLAYIKQWVQTSPNLYFIKDYFICYFS